MRPVNLLPEDRKKREKQSFKLSPMHGAVAAMLIGAGALGYWGNGIRGDVTEQKALVVELEQQATGLTAQIAEAKAKNAAPTESNYVTDKALVSGLANSRVNWSTVMVNLARVAPSGVWLKSLGVQTPTGGAAAGGAGNAAAGNASTARPAAITLEAGAKTRTDAALFLARLNGVRGFVDPRLQGGIDEVEDENGKVAGFSFTVLIPVDDSIFAPGTRPAAPAQPTAATATPTPQP